MNRVIVVALCAGVTLITFLSLRTCFQSIFPTEKSSQVPKIDNSIVALDDGSVMIAKPGTLSRDVIDWFNDKRAGPRQFDLGRQPFISNSDLPAPEAELRLGRFATEFKANPDVNARIIVCGSGDNAADRQLAAGRAERLKQELVAKRIEASRITTQTCDLPVAVGNAPSASAQGGQDIGIALSRGG